MSPIHHLDCGFLHKLKYLSRKKAANRNAVELCGRSRSRPHVADAKLVEYLAKRRRCGRADNSNCVTLRSFIGASFCVNYQWLYCREHFIDTLIVSMVFDETVVAVEGDLFTFVFVGEEVINLFKEIVFAFVAYVFVTVFEDVGES